MDRDGRGPRDIASLGEITPAGLRTVFTGWRIFGADGAWWAIRGGRHSRVGPESMLLCALAASDLTGLAERLCIQEWLDGLSPDELAALYRREAGEPAR